MCVERKSIECEYADLLEDAKEMREKLNMQSLDNALLCLCKYTVQEGVSVYVYDQNYDLKHKHEITKQAKILRVAYMDGDFIELDPTSEVTDP